ncbi:T37 [Tupaiid betaherpesvirus 1]|uniref:T37 n=1 Tax=Tupaiid herpesvirus 1 (strain 1) TaxID=10397 RepID=Q91TQ6_TUHV1|nr:T37 [Tupaiid betaherpesvirus 1]AAK57081.1 T37 [Tupaiid betaherpesvirus 1]
MGWTVGWQVLAGPGDRGRSGSSRTRRSDWGTGATSKPTILKSTGFLSQILWLATACFVYVDSVTVFHSVVIGDIDCQYDVCFFTRRNGKTSFRCSIECYFNATLVYVGDCGMARDDLLWNRVSSQSSMNDGVAASLDLGLHYYMDGYLIRGIVARTGWAASPGVTWFSGRLFCWRNDTLGGQIGFNFSDSYYTFSVHFIEGYKEEVHKWVRRSGRQQTLVEQLLFEGAYHDDNFLRTACPKLVRRIGNRVERLKSNLPESRAARTCGGRSLVPGWTRLWANWTKYSEMALTTGRRAYVIGDYDVGDRPGKKLQLSKLLGLFAVIGGTLMMTVLFCVLSLLRRREIVRDLRRRRDSLDDPVTKQVT